MVLRNLESISRSTASCRRSVKSIQVHIELWAGDVRYLFSFGSPFSFASCPYGCFAAELVGGGMRLKMQKVKASPRVTAKTLAWRPADPLRLDAEGSSYAFPRRNRNGHTAKATKALH